LLSRKEQILLKGTCSFQDCETVIFVNFYSLDVTGKSLGTRLCIPSQEIDSGENKTEQPINQAKKD
jgi:hypothetical protein